MWHLAGFDSPGCTFNIIIHPDELHINMISLNLQGDVAGTQVAIFWLADTAIIDEKPAAGKNPVIRYMDFDSLLDVFSDWLIQPGIALSRMLEY
jgi:hypothetical protein